MKWLGRQRQKEDLLERGHRFDKIALPGRYDVVVGRGKPFRSYTGNVWFTQLIEDHQDAYYSGGGGGGTTATTASSSSSSSSRTSLVGRGSKAKIVRNVMDLVHQRGRFVYRDPDGWWVEADEATTIEKISGAFRTLRHRRQAKAASAAAANSHGGSFGVVANPTTSRSNPSDMVGSSNKRAKVGEGIPSAVGCFSHCCAEKESMEEFRNHVSSATVSFIN